MKTPPTNCPICDPEWDENYKYTGIQIEEEILRLAEKIQKELEKLPDGYNQGVSEVITGLMAAGKQRKII